jgi:phosphate transport system permease protein
MSNGSRRLESSKHLAAQGEPMIWLTGGMFAIACLMILGLLSFVLYQGLSTLWPRTYLMLGMMDGELVGGEFRERQSYVLSQQNLKDLGPKSRSAAESLLGEQSEVTSQRWYLRTGNFELTNRHFQFVAEVSIASKSPYYPRDLWLLERREWGNLYGFPKSLSWSTPSDASLAESVRSAMTAWSGTAHRIETAKKALGRIDRKLTEARLQVREVELREGSDLQRITDEVSAATASLGEGTASLDEVLQPILAPVSPRAQQALQFMARAALAADKEQLRIGAELTELEGKAKEQSVTMLLPITEEVGRMELERTEWTQRRETIPDSLRALFAWGPEVTQVASDPIAFSEHQILLQLTPKNAPTEWAWVVWDEMGPSAAIHKFREHEVLVSDIVRLIEPNRLSWFGKLGVYASRWMEFLLGEPREAGVEGGVFPAIWGTIVMTLIMSLAVMPFGVLAALYMREYAKSGWLLSLIRISINNLAGVPSIVYGVFGLSFFCYTLGGYIDGGPIKAGFEPWPSAIWFSALALFAVVGLLAFGTAFLLGGAKRENAALRRTLSMASGILWLATLVGIAILLAKTPMFHGFYESRLPNPTFGKGCLLWAACTLALLTLPVVIVATEEALAAVPNSLREGSYACGAGKWQTIQRIVLPHARPGIITGFILAMARGAGEVAPMMLVGAIPLAAELPLDLEFPFLHGSRAFMHLGFQIYALGFQSQNSEAAKPMVFTATLLLLTLVTLLNLTAIWLRARLRKRFQSSQF